MMRQQQLESSYMRAQRSLGQPYLTFTKHPILASSMTRSQHSSRGVLASSGLSGLLRRMVWPAVRLTAARRLSSQIQSLFGARRILDHPLTSRLLDVSVVTDSLTMTRLRIRLHRAAPCSSRTRVENTSTLVICTISGQMSRRLPQWCRRQLGRIDERRNGCDDLSLR